MSAFSERWQWRSIPRSSTLPQVIDHLNERGRALDQMINRWADDLEYGPIPGQYLLIPFSRSVAGGLTTGTQDLVPLSFDAVPKALYAWIPGGGANQVTIQVNNDTGNPILASNLAVTGDTVLNDPGDFAVSRVSGPNLFLEIISIDVGPVAHITVALMLQGVTNVEDQ